MSHPTIPAAAYPARGRKVQAMMVSEGLDVVVAYTDDRAVFGPPMPAGLPTIRCISNRIAF